VAARVKAIRVEATLVRFIVGSAEGPDRPNKPALVRSVASSLKAIAPI
jgi:hypothetical protein